MSSHSGRSGWEVVPISGPLQTLEMRQWDISPTIRLPVTCAKQDCRKARYQEIPLLSFLTSLQFSYPHEAYQRPRSKDIMLSASWVVSSIASLMSFASDTTWAWKAATEQGWTRTTPALDKVLQSKADVVAMSFLGKTMCHATRCKDYHFSLQLHENPDSAMPLLF